MTLDYQIKGNEDDSELVIAVVQKQAISKVKRGENEGRTLAHAQIVRQLNSFNLENAEKGKLNISIPEDFNSKGWEIIALLQQPKTRAISAAGRVAL
ncbi:hypothetical protein D3C86_1848920 [compost metagenome]